MNHRLVAVTGLAATIALGTAACSSSSPSSASGSASSSAAASSAAASSAPASSAASSTPAASTPAAAGSAAAAAMDFGPACSAVPKSGAGSFSGMATAPVATAASNNPVLSTLVAAVKKAGLVDTLNSASNITVFAPDNAAFAKIPAATLDKVLANKVELTKILTYHVAAGRYTPAQLASGAKIKTLEGGTVTPGRAGGSYQVNGASVVCGNVQTANATVYIINTVLMPPSS